MTPEQFEAEMKAIVDMHPKGSPDGEDIASRHMCMDDLMCNMLTELGYGAGVEVFNENEKWYA